MLKIKLQQSRLVHDKCSEPHFNSIQQMIILLVAVLLIACTWAQCHFKYYAKKVREKYRVMTIKIELLIQRK